MPLQHFVHWNANTKERKIKKNIWPRSYLWVTIKCMNKLAYEWLNPLLSFISVFLCDVKMKDLVSSPSFGDCLSLFGACYMENITGVQRYCFSFKNGYKKFFNSSIIALSLSFYIKARIAISRTSAFVNILPEWNLKITTVQMCIN